jgi:RES domain-containing protein
MRLWRLIKTKYASTAFDGEGARLHGARWNSPGTRVAYASSNSALAVLEVLVHMTAGGILPAYSLITATLADTYIEVLPASDLPRDWASSPVPPELQAIGDAWIRSSRSLALRVPGAVVQGSHNILINPKHADFAQFTVESTEPFDFDPRLLR